MESPLENSDILQHILSFVGKKQFRFVTTISRNFQRTYVELFPYDRKTTYCTVPSIGHAKICFEERHRENFVHECLLCDNAAKYGNLPVLQYLRSVECAWNAWTCASAAEHGHLSVLKWARANGCLWDEQICRYAAQNGHLNVLQWSRANGCPWDQWTCSYAAKNGHLTVLQWALANGCPWDRKKALNHAIAFGHTEVVEWIDTNYPIK